MRESETETAIQTKYGYFFGKYFSCEFVALNLIINVQKDFIPISIGLCIIPLQSYIEILKKYILLKINMCARVCLPFSMF